jgi:hypothetical protein
MYCTMHQVCALPKYMTTVRIRPIRDVLHDHMCYMCFR